MWTDRHVNKQKTRHPELTYGVAEVNPKLTATAFACEVVSGSHQRGFWTLLSKPYKSLFFGLQRRNFISPRNDVKNRNPRHPELVSGSHQRSFWTLLSKPYKSLFLGLPRRNFISPRNDVMGVMLRLCRNISLIRFFANAQNDERKADFNSLFTIHNSPRLAFTMAEVLITLGIIGIVATMVIPPLIAGSQDAQYKTGKDKVRMSIAEAGRLMSIDGTISDASSAEDFVKNYLSKRLKIIKYCAPADMEQCGMPSGTITKLKKEDGTEVASMPSTWSTITNTNRLETKPLSEDSYVFLSADGIAVNLFYNQYCAVNSKDKNLGMEYYQDSLDTACMSGVYDMNGLKKPNQVGKDIGFFGVFYNNAINPTAVAALPYKANASTTLNWNNADNYCRGITGYKLPSIDELSALYLGKNITGINESNILWSSSLLEDGNPRAVLFLGGRSSLSLRLGFTLSQVCQGLVWGWQL